MEVEESSSYRKRKSRSGKQKLVVNDKVEVRSREEGFEGSWHPGKVIKCGKQIRHVRYENILTDDGSDKLIDKVTVSSVLDGVGFQKANQCNVRGHMRPLAPPVEFRKSDLTYGLCVDVNYQEAWWEGVICDHDNGMEERSIFFPDLGDQLKIGIDCLRITQDWDELSGNWKQRGNWVLFELIEECAPGSCRFVSVKQIWYDVRGKIGFVNIGDWTFNAKDLWKKLVLEVLDDYFDITLKEFFGVFDFSKSGLLKDAVEVEYVEVTPNVDMNLKVDMANLGTFGNPANTDTMLHDDSNPKNVVGFDGTAVDNPPKKSDLATSMLDTDSNSGNILHVQEENGLDLSKDEAPRSYIIDDSNLSCGEKEPTPAVDINPEVSDFQATGTYVNPPNRDTVTDADSNHNVFGSDVRAVDNQLKRGALAVRLLDTISSSVTIPPIQEESGMVPEATSEMCTVNDSNTFHTHKEVLVQNKLMIPIQEALSEFPEGICCTNSGISSEGVPGTSSNGDNGKPKCLTHRRTRCSTPVILPGAKFCEDAVVDYALAGTSKKLSNPLLTNVRKHLLYLGWKIEKFKDSYMYYSPDKNCYDSLRKICQEMKDDILMRKSLTSQADHIILPTSPNNKCPNLPDEQQEKSQGSDSCQLIVPPSSDQVVVPPEYCPQAVLEYCLNDIDSTCDGHASNIMILKARKHLSAAGWRMFRYHTKSGKRLLQYRSPQRNFYSLGAACEGYLKERLAQLATSAMRPIETKGINKEDEGLVDGDKLSSKTSKGVFRKSSTMPKSGKLLRLEKGKFKGNRKIQSRKEQNLLNLILELLQKDPELHAIEDGTASALISKGNLRHFRNPESSQLKLDGNRLSGTLTRVRENNEGIHHMPVLWSSKRVQQVCPFSPQKPLNVLSWLIDNNIVLPRAKVYYGARGSILSLAEGKITCHGIKCTCCKTLWSRSAFEDHAGGSSYGRPSSHIFLEDGRSILDCQIQIIQNHNMRGFLNEPCDMEGKWSQGENDSICSVCHYGGELILCDLCPSSFHQGCLGLKDVPDGEWFCPSCCCGVCGQSKFKDDAEDGCFLTCSQCQHKYHIRCLGKREAQKSKIYQEWFCSKSCEKIWLGLNKLLGIPIPVGVNNLSWTLMKSIKSDNCSRDDPDIDFLAESHSKLNVSLAVMHECFEPLQEPDTSADLVEDVIFSRWSELNRLNFRGFYTVLLERNDEIISVATVRVFGEKVAEVPLVGTRFQYRRQGMCRILMDELEKKLMELGVERLVLPAVPNVLNTWTTSFGFSKMTNSERSKFLDYTFLDFQGTIMCQKFLKNILSPHPVLSKGIQRKLRVVVSGSGSESESGVTVNQLNNPECEPCLDETSPEYSLKDIDFERTWRNNCS
ncbi:PHD zinc finger protein [Quillaja saponaria]|uniref:PHD zinc finger protein n=1 Tax=Quillaja saponaria TaxID=32244 RepID=A0AAD7PLC1_QUISA|nr:PHD zinc finger protein [Quillaja saponaria]